MPDWAARRVPLGAIRPINHDDSRSGAATQAGTLYRLVHALSAANVAEGWAVDENTALEVADDVVTVHGSGAATRVLRQGSGVSLAVHVAGNHVPVWSRGIRAAR